MTTTSPKMICDYQGSTYVAARISPRGFANETTTYVMLASDVVGIAALTAKLERIDNRDAGDSAFGRWLNGQEIAQHLFRIRNRDGNIYAMSIDADGNPYSLVI